ncbi:hypothetical protein PAHAL_4G301600 [Panicum hallii]|uniref:Uncharacterized protein n=1 Tax=Panicum hallii TaxID=206008 RepID=A0A2S3HLB1_9POAL|nr:hypothetical protein PAHAL_4G301600 [Panicum hallii]
MATEDSKDILKNVDWKTVGGSVTTESSQPIVKKRLPKKIRQVPDCYFLPRRSWPSSLAMVLFVLLGLVQGCCLRCG